MSERAMLLQLVEAADGIEPNWEDALGRAGFRGRHLARGHRPLSRRRALVLVAAALAVIYVVSAVAADRQPIGLVGGLVDRSDETYPVRQVPELGEWVRRPRSGAEFRQSQKELACIAQLREVDLGPRAELKCMDRVPAIRAVPVLQGAITGHRFEMSTWFSDPDQYLGFSPGGPARPLYRTKVPGVGAGWGTFQIQGVTEPLDHETLHWVSIIATYTGQGPITKDGVGRGPKWLFGAANPNVARVDLENTNDGTVVSVPTIEPPEGLPVGVRFWVAALRLDQLVHVVVPRDRDGDELERWELNLAL